MQIYLRILMYLILQMGQSYYHPLFDGLMCYLQAASKWPCKHGNWPVVQL